MLIHGKNFGFGCMRLPMKDDKVDYEQFCEMTDYFIENGFTYFDTAHGYISGQSETAIRDCVSARHPRDSFTLTNKLTDCYFNSEEDIRPFFEKQLELCGVDYFDYYLMHALNSENYRKYQNCNAFKVVSQLKKEGKIRHFGISFHDTADVLKTILDDHPEIEVVQLQFNYIDFDDAAVQSGKCYRLCREYGKPVIVMEPVKGGSLVKLPDKAQDIFSSLGENSNASYAIRFAAGFEGIEMVLSGMSDMEQMKDNVSFMKDFKPLNEKELAAVEKVCAVFKGLNIIPCTGCRYCTDGCPMSISIPDLFACLNAKTAFNDWNQDYYYSTHTQSAGKASDCIECGNCEYECPQHLPIRELLKEVALTFEKKEK